MTYQKRKVQKLELALSETKGFIIFLSTSQKIFKARILLKQNIGKFIRKVGNLEGNFSKNI